MKTGGGDMSSTAASLGFAEMLLAGPRGRRLLLEYALASEISQNPVRDAGSFGSAAVRASQRLGPGKRSTRALIGSVPAKTELRDVTPAEVAERLNRLELLEPTPESLPSALASAVAHARYWKEPDGEEILTETSEMRLALRRVAQKVAASPPAAWWCTPAATHTQQSVQWDDAPPRRVLDDVIEALLAASDRERAAEQASREKRHVNGGSEWWSRPPGAIPSSTRSLFDGSPAGLWFVEDSLGWERAESIGLIVPRGVHVFEIEGAAEWAELCARFPLEVTAQKRHNWDRSTRPAARWVVPDWAQVAEHYDAVHLQVGAYLAAAGTAIPVDDSGTASVIAGWGPDETYWFTPDVAYDDVRARWALKDVGTDMVWVPDRP